MDGPLGSRAAGAWLTCLALALSACGAASSSSSSSGRSKGGDGGGGRGGDSAPARDTFAGSIASGTGSFVGASGRVVVYLHPRGQAQTRRVRVVIRGRCGVSAQSCTQLNGVLSGELSASPGGVPDTGRGYSLTAAGLVKPLGHVTMRGDLAGTGFISRGQEVVRLTFSSSSGSVTVRAHSRRVKGFTSP